MILGEFRIREFTHPDSINVTVFEVEQVKLATGKYAKHGQIYWGSMTLEPFVSRECAEVFIANCEKLNEKQNNDNE